MQNYVDLCDVHFFCFRSKKTEKELSVKAEIWCQETNLNMRNSMMMLTFFSF